MDPQNAEAETVSVDISASLSSREDMGLTGASEWLRGEFPHLGNRFVFDDPCTTNQQPSMVDTYNTGLLYTELVRVASEAFGDAVVSVLIGSVGKPRGFEEPFFYLYTPQEGAFAAGVLLEDGDSIRCIGETPAHALVLALREVVSR